jgi:hypothetical protein
MRCCGQNAPFRLIRRFSRAKDDMSADKIYITAANDAQVFKNRQRSIDG